MTHRPTCAVLIYDGGFRVCAAPSMYVVTIGGDQLFRICQRHDKRLKRDGIVLAPERPKP